MPEQLPSPWLSINEACQEYDFRRPTLEVWRRSGCPLLGGNKPRNRLEKPSRGQSFFVFHRDDLKRIVEARAAGGTRPAGEGQWVSAKEAAREFGLSETRIRLWGSEGCPQAGGTILRSVTKHILQANGSPRPVQLYDHEQLRQFVSRRDTLLAAADRDWISGRQAREEFGLDVDALYKWHLHGCCYLGGKKLLARKAPANVGGRVQTIKQFDRRQVEEIVRRLADEQGCRAYQDAAGGWLPARLAEQRYNIIPQHLVRWRDRPCSFLGGRRLRAQRVKKLSRTKYGGEEWAYSEEDLKQIAAGRRVEKPAVYKDDEGTWLFACEVERRFGFPADNLWYYRRKAYPFLPVGRIRARQVSSALHPRQHNKMPRCWVYHEADLLRIEAWRRGEPLPPNPPEPSDPVEEAEPHLGSPAQPTRRRGCCDEQGKYPGHQRKPRERGPEANPERETVLAFCYDEYIAKGRPQGDVLRDAGKFGARYAPKTTAHVRAFARQWAARWQPPLPLDRRERGGTR